MKEKGLKGIFTAIFLILCLLPSAGMLVFGTSPAAANEVLSPKPRILDRDGAFNPEVLSETSDYIADRFWLRQKCVTAWSEINAALFRTSVDDSVILGRNGWIYYSETLDDYMGNGTPDDELSSAARNLALLQEYSEDCGAEFVFTVAPNKNSLYPDNMPQGIPSAHEMSDAERLKPLLEKNGVNYADLFDAFSQEERVLYYETDSHWNSEGAALGADRILRAAGQNSSFFDMEYTEGEEHTGDIYEMLYPCGTRRERDRVPVNAFCFETASPTNGGKALKIESENLNGKGRLICWRDSFGNALYPYLAESFSQALFLRESTYDLTRLEPGSADTVIIELVERNIDWLIRYVPVLPAPKRNVAYSSEGPSIDAEISDGSENSHEGLSHIEIVLGKEMYDFGSPAYISCGESVFEAWVSYTDKGEAALSAWVPTAEAADVGAVCSCSGVLTHYSAN